MAVWGGGIGDTRARGVGTGDVRVEEDRACEVCGAGTGAETGFGGTTSGDGEAAAADAMKA